MGVDYSTNCVDVVAIEELVDPRWVEPRWFSFPLFGLRTNVASGSWERTRNVQLAVPGPMAYFWEPARLVAIEIPHGHAERYLNRVLGAIIVRIPMKVDVMGVTPHQWKKALGLGGNCKPPEYREWALADGWKLLENDEVTDDAAAAYCIARAARLITERDEEEQDARP